jgi:hypothetical protein
MAVTRRSPRSDPFVVESLRRHLTASTSTLANTKAMGPILEGPTPWRKVLAAAAIDELFISMLRPPGIWMTAPSWLLVQAMMLVILRFARRASIISTLRAIRTESALVRVVPVMTRDFDSKPRSSIHPRWTFGILRPGNLRTDIASRTE